MRIITLLLAIFVLVGCNKEVTHRTPLIEGLTPHNFPVMDGSTSTKPLIDMAASRLLGYECKWVPGYGEVTYSMQTSLPRKFSEQKLLCSQTHGSIINLIDGGADMIFSARGPSADERDYASRAGVELILTPVALDALIFMKHRGVYTGSLTHEQIQDIYTLRATNWNEVGGQQDLPIVPFVRNRNSGSQELMESLVMSGPLSGDFEIDRFEDFQILGGMAPVFSNITLTKGSIGYTVFYYKENMVRDYFKVGTIRVNDISPTKATIKDRTYPFISEVYLIIRSDLDPASMAYRVYEYMKSAAGARIIDESGYVPI